MNSKKKVIVGVILIVISIAGLVSWETFGRKMVMYDSVLVAKRDIAAGQIIGADMVREADVLSQNVLAHSIKSGNGLSAYAGMTVKQFIPAGAQITTDYFYKDDFYVKKGENIFVIPSEWIESMSSSIRRGDVVEFWQEGARYRLGEYRIAFVKSGGIDEVREINEQSYAEALDRTDPTAQPTQIEIIATVSDYKKLFEYVYGDVYTEKDTGDETEREVKNHLLLIQKESGAETSSNVNEDNKNKSASENANVNDDMSELTQ